MAENADIATFENSVFHNFYSGLTQCAAFVENSAPVISRSSSDSNSNYVSYSSASKRCLIECPNLQLRANIPIKNIGSLGHERAQCMPVIGPP